MFSRISPPNPYFSASVIERKSIVVICVANADGRDSVITLPGSRCLVDEHVCRARRRLEAGQSAVSSIASAARTSDFVVECLEVRDAKDGGSAGQQARTGGLRADRRFEQHGSTWNSPSSFTNLHRCAGSRKTAPLSARTVVDCARDPRCPRRKDAGTDAAIVRSMRHSTGPTEGTSATPHPSGVVGPLRASVSVEQCSGRQ